MKTNTIKANANVKIYLNNKLVRQQKNLIVTVGREFAADRIISATQPVMSHMAIGSNSGLGAQLITNPSMELDSNWASFNSPTSNVRSSEQAHVGTYSRKITTVDNDYRGIESDHFAVSVDWEYRTRAWVYPLNVDSVYVALLHGDGDRWWTFKKFEGLTLNAWNGIEFYTLGTRAGTSARLIFLVDNPSTGTYIDNVDVRTTVQLSETALKTETDRQSLTTVSRSGSEITYIGEWLAGVGTGTIAEAGIFNDPVAGTMLARAAFDDINKGISDSLLINWKLNLISN